LIENSTYACAVQKPRKEMVLGMKRAAIIVLAIATFVLIVSPTAYPLASTPTKSGTYAPSVITPYAGSTVDSGPSNSTGGGGTGGGTDQGDADGLSGLKIKPGTTNTLGIGSASDRIAIMLVMWWRYMVLIR
jgi:hypothetical protein